jgi:hypothetical protein
MVRSLVRTTRTDLDPGFFIAARCCPLKDGHPSLRSSPIGSSTSRRSDCRERPP